MLDVCFRIAVTIIGGNINRSKAKKHHKILTAGYIAWENDAESSVNRHISVVLRGWTESQPGLTGIKNGYSPLGIAGLIAYGFHAVQFLKARAATHWMNIYWLSDIRDWQELTVYWRELKTGIPPVLSTVEIVSVLLTGSARWWIVDAYHVFMVFAFVLPLYFVRRKWLDAILGWVLCLLFLTAVARISPANPEFYDVAFPCFALAYFIFTDLSFKKKYKPRILNLYALTAGFFLSHGGTLPALHAGDSSFANCL